MKKADGNLYFRRLFAYILIPFFAGPFSGGLPTPAITMRPPEPSFYFIYFCIYLKFNIFVAIKIWRSSF